MLDNDICYTTVKSQDAIVIKLGYRPPYNWPMMLDFFSMRTIPGVESVKDNCYRRSLRLLSPELISGWLEVKPLVEENKVELSVSRSLEKGLLEVIKIVKTAFDLDASPTLLPKDLPDGIRLPGCFDSFEMATRAILGQQITVKAARTLTQRLVETLGNKMESPWEEIKYHFPEASTISLLETSIESILGPLGIIKSRSRSIYTLAQAIASNEIQLKSGVSASNEKIKLLALKGIGPWTAEYLIMRGISYADAFPVSDIGVKHALAPFLKDQEGNLLIDNNNNLSKYKLNKLYEKEAIIYADKFKPWRSYLTIFLWYSLGLL
jgi:AraC family transcriptional regulator of adaptative response / DNA-3-methyladenine glycosylase II